MKKILKTITLIILLCTQQGVFAQQTTPQYLTVTCPICRSVVINGGTLSATINPDTGALSNSLNPGFKITTNSHHEQSLVMSASATIQSGSTNAVFNILSTKYIILTNSSVLPDANAITDIKGANPSAPSNPNAIAYQINDPTGIHDVLEVEYNSSNKNWDLTLEHIGTTTTSITIPSGTARSGTYSADDEAGSYQATITLSFT